MIQKALLLLIDLQTDFLNQNGLEPHKETVTDAAAYLLEMFRAHQLPVAHVVTKLPKDGHSRMPHWKARGIELCVEGSAGADSPPQLQPLPGERVFTKQWFSAFSNRIFEDYLRQAGITDLILAGVHLQTCLRQTAIDAYQKGFGVSFAREACGSHNPLHGALSLDYLTDRAMPAFGTAEIFERFCAEPTTRPLGVIGELNFTEMTARARNAQTGWAAGPMPERVAVLHQLMAWLEDEKESFAALIVKAVNKPIFYARGEVARTIALIAAIIARANLFVDTSRGPEGSLRYRPRGVVAIITPWNNPLAIPVGKLAAALAYGNAVIWKPAPAAIGVAGRLMEGFRQARMPHHLIQVVEGDASVARQVIAAGVDAVAFSGSSQTGWSIIAQTSSRLLPLQAELGGNNAAIICSSADLRQASMAIAEGAFGFAGQRCTANRRVIVVNEIYRDFLAALISATADLSCGKLDDPATRFSPMISSQAAQRISRIVARARSAGYDVIQPQGSHAMADPFHPPTIICCDQPDAFIVQEESFGPILVVQKAQDFADALRLQNAVPYGLVAALFSAETADQIQFIATADAGILKINSSTVNAGVDIPFTGWKHSGFGAAEHGEANQEFFTKRQAVYATSAG